MPKVQGSKPGWREQQVGLSVDRRAILLLRPGERRIVRAQPGLDMSDGDACSETRERRTQGAGRIALHDDQVGLSSPRKERGGHLSHMQVRILAPGAIEMPVRVVGKTIFGRLDRLLAGAHE